MPSGPRTLAGLNWSVLAGNAAQFDKPTMRLAFILILLGYGTKAGIAPMHTWKPDVYSEAPVPGAAMLATGVLNCALYGLVRFYILTSKCLGPQFGSQLLILFGLLSMGVAVPFILVQKNFRRLLAYSQHRPRRNHGAGARIRRASGYPGHAAAHDLSHRSPSPCCSFAPGTSSNI